MMLSHQTIVVAIKNGFQKKQILFWYADQFRKVGSGKANQVLWGGHKAFLCERWLTDRGELVSVVRLSQKERRAKGGSEESLAYHSEASELEKWLPSFLFSDSGVLKATIGKWLEAEELIKKTTLELVYGNDFDAKRFLRMI